MNGCRAGTHEKDFLVKTEQIRSEATRTDPHSLFFAGSFFLCSGSVSKICVFK